MYQSSSSSSSSTSHSSVGQISNNATLKRYDSAPGSFLTATVDSIIGQPPRSKELSPLGAHRYPESSCEDQNQNQNNLSMMMRSFAAASSNSSPLVRHTSLPAGFLNPLASPSTSDNNVTRNYNFHGGSDSGNGIQRLNSQLSFTRQDSLSQITEESEDADEDIHADGHRKASHAFATDSYGMGWDNSNTIMFSGGTGKRAKNDSVGGLSMSESQFQFGLSQTALDMATMEQMMDIPHDSVPCKARAKRGCATHPRSIAERERRTRISGKLKKLQDLVPNMDKQTSYADMLDLAVQHIKGLQTQVQKLNTDLEHCTCGCKKNGQCNQ